MLRVTFNFDITQQIGLTNEMIQYNRRTYRKRAIAKSRTVIISTNKNGWISVKRKVLKTDMYQNYISTYCGKKYKVRCYVEKN